MGLHIAPQAALPFADRAEAGKALGDFLKAMADEFGIPADRIVTLGLPRGGVVVAGEVARCLGSALDVLPSRKLGAPGNPELAIGAVSVAGEPYMAPSALQIASEEWIDRETESQRARISEQLRKYRKDADFAYLRGKVGLIVDDGTATGATAVAACMALRHLGAGSVWVAVPVAPPEALDLLASLADEVFCLASRADFQAVGMWYVDFGQTSDEEVHKILSDFGGVGAGP
jgi:putative phosphoribosyl transferase